MAAVVRYYVSSKNLNEKKAEVSSLCHLKGIKVNII